MFIHPQFDPIAIHLGPLAVRWYGLMYLAGFALIWVVGVYAIKTRPHVPWGRQQFADALFCAILGVIIGGRLGYVLFYKLGDFVREPLRIFYVWEGGMSFHGGFLGVIIALAWFARKQRLSWLAITDFAAPLVPLALATGRLGNFINAELWGRPTDVPWAMIFPNADRVPRHPSQLYEFALEGIVLFVILWIYSSKPRAQGTVSAAFLIGYGVLRFAIEFTREPDSFLGLLAFNLSMGQWLSLPMVLAGVLLAAWAVRAGAKAR
jgi:phosphatidylglycerol:prolipoprotein diacylglycerol transferase